MLLLNWYKANKLSLKLCKTVLLKFWPDNNAFEINVNGIWLQNEKYTKFLGIFVDDTLSWKEHANKVINRVHVNRKLLSNSKNLLSANALRNVYHAHIYSHLTYGLVVWGSMLDNIDRNTIYKAQKQCVQIITHSKQTAHTDPLFKKLNMLHFPDLIRLELVKLGYRLTNRLVPLPI